MKLLWLFLFLYPEIHDTILHTNTYVSVYICYVGRLNKNGITEVQHIVFLHTTDLLGEIWEKSELKKSFIYFIRGWPCTMTSLIFRVTRTVHRSLSGSSQSREHLFSDLKGAEYSLRSSAGTGSREGVRRRCSSVLRSEWWVGHHALSQLWVGWFLVPQS